MGRMLSPPNCARLPKSVLLVGVPGLSIATVAGHTAPKMVLAMVGAAARGPSLGLVAAAGSADGWRVAGSLAECSAPGMTKRRAKLVGAPARVAEMA